MWLYLDTVNKTTHSNRIWTLQTLASQESKETVLSLTLTDGSNVKYIVKLLQADQRATKEPISKETVSSFDLEKPGTALNISDNPLPVGVALKISN